MSKQGFNLRELPLFSVLKVAVRCTLWRVLTVVSSYCTEAVHIYTLEFISPKRI